MKVESCSSRVLFFRLGSLGDIVMSLSALENLPPKTQVEWVVAAEYVSLLDGHPAIARVWEFNKKEGLIGWLRLCSQLRRIPYDRVVDLHFTLRTRLARIVFICGGGKGLRLAATRWKTVNKQRIRLWGFFVLKGLFPKKWKPTPWVERYSECATGNPHGRPSLRHLLKGDVTLSTVVPELKGRHYIVVMPSSRWSGKEWDVEKYADLLQGRGELPIVLGSDADIQSRKLVQELTRRGVPFVLGIGRWNWKELAVVVSGATAYLGADTGMAHVAESLGVKAKVIWGPTDPGMGFGPWRPESIAIGKKLWCRPCGKDGRNCFRILKKHHCLRSLSFQEVEKQLREVETRK